MPCLKGKCAYHFIMAGTLVEDHFPDCEIEHSFSQRVWGDYSKFRSSFCFQKYIYILLQLQHATRQEGPRCHGDHTFKKGGKCAFEHVIFKVAFCIWLDKSLMERMVAELGVRESVGTLEGFIQWANTENKQKGNYTLLNTSTLWPVVCWIRSMTGFDVQVRVGGKVSGEVKLEAVIRHDERCFDILIICFVVTASCRSLDTLVFASWCRNC